MASVNIKPLNKEISRATYKGRTIYVLKQYDGPEVLWQWVVDTQTTNIVSDLKEIAIISAIEFIDGDYKPQNVHTIPADLAATLQVLETLKGIRKI